MHSLTLVVAFTENEGIGRNNRLPWHPASLGADMCWFRKLTQGMFRMDGLTGSSEENVVVMGRKTWDSIPLRFKPLPGRLNVVLSRSRRETGDAVFISNLHELEHACSRLKNPQVFVVGGHDIYRLAMESGQVRHIFVTEVTSQKRHLECDTFFPTVSWECYRKEDITSNAADVVDGGIRSRCYHEGLNAFAENGMTFKMFLYTRHKM